MKHYKQMANDFYNKRNVILPHNYQQPNAIEDLKKYN